MAPQAAKSAIADYLTAITSLLINIFLNKEDHEQTRDPDRRIVYLVDNDIVGFCIHPGGRQAAYTNFGFLKQHSIDEFVHAVLSGEYLMGGALPGQHAAPLYLLPSHYDEMLIMDAAVNRDRDPKEASKHDGDTEDSSYSWEESDSIDELKAHLQKRHDGKQSQQILLAHLRNKAKISSFDDLKFEYRLQADVPFQRRIDWLKATKEAQRLLLTPQPAGVMRHGSRFETKRIEINNRRDATALALAEQIREQVLASSKGRCSVCFVSGSNAVRQAFRAVARPPEGFSIAEYWLREPLQYSPCLNLKTLSEIVDERFMIDALEQVVRDALKDWPEPTDRFEVSKFSDKLSGYRSEWLARLPETFATDRVQALEEEWLKVATAATGLLRKMIANRLTLLENSAAGTFDPKQDDLAASERAALSLRHNSLRFDAFRELFRSASRYKDIVEPNAINRPISVPIRIGEKDRHNLAEIEHRLRRILDSEREPLARELRSIYRTLEREHSAMILCTAALALKAHQWSQARHWALAVAIKGLAPIPDIWLVPDLSAERNFSVEQSWIIRCAAARYSAFKTDGFGVVKGFAQTVIAYHRAKDHIMARLIMQAELTALEVFGALQLKFGNIEEIARVRPAAPLDRLEPLLYFAKSSINDFQQNMPALRERNKPVADELAAKLARNISILAGIRALFVGPTATPTAEPWYPELQWAYGVLTEGIHAELIRQALVQLNKISRG
jgi:hypothetical protein